MPLYIKDPAVDNLLEQYLSATSETNKTEAVRMLLTDGLRRLPRIAARHLGWIVPNAG